MQEKLVNEARQELIMQVAGMTGDACVAAVTAAVLRLDPGAEVRVDLAHARATIRTVAQALEVADTLDKAGFEATGMTL